MKQSVIYITTFIFALLSAMTACQSEPATHVKLPVGQGALAVGLTTGPNVSVDNVQLFVFDNDNSGTLKSHLTFSRPELMAEHLHCLPCGHYTVIAIINALSIPVTDQKSTLSEIADALKRESDHNPRLQTGIAITEISTENLSYVQITLTQGITAIGTATVMVRFHPFPTEMPECPSDDTRSSRNNAPIRCVAELQATKDRQIASHITVSPQLQPDGMYAFELTAVKGTYSLLLWTESADMTHYSTDRLNEVTIGQNVILQPSESCLTASAAVPELILDNDTSLTVDMQPAAGLIRIIANDIDYYRSLSAQNEDMHPPLTNVKVTIEFTGYYPRTFDVMTHRVIDSDMNHCLTHTLDLSDTVGPEAMVVETEMLAHSFTAITADITVTDMVSGQRISKLPKLKINYDAGHTTTIRTNLFTCGISTGSVIIDNDWEDIIIQF